MDLGMPSLNTDLFKWLDEEVPILTDKEKEYLKVVLKPFKDDIIYLKKVEAQPSEEVIEYLLVELRFSEDITQSMSFPFFEKGTMYKGMELYKKYTLKELGLFEEIEK